MKKCLTVVLLICLMFTLTCGKSMADTDTVNIDVDLTELNSMIIYAQLFNMVMNASDYLGKTVKMRGTYSASPSAQENQYSHFIVIDDETECCSQGLEFTWNGEHNYPEEKAIIEIVGVFSSNTINNRAYYYLAVDELDIVK